MGIVYAAEDTQTGRQVALKVVAQCRERNLPRSPSIRSRRRDRFLIEVQTTAKLDHPHIVTVYSAERSADYAYYTMKLIEGVDLRQLIDALIECPPEPDSSQLTRIKDLLLQPEPLPNCSDDPTRSIADSAAVSDSSGVTQPRPVKTPESESIEVDSGVLGGPMLSREVFAFFAHRVAEAADAIAYANEQGVLHRDIKPSNLILDREGKIYVTDFGLAKWMGGNDDEDDSTACVGTRGYIAPECLKSSSAVNERSEVYSIGCVLHKLMTLTKGRPPESGDPSWKTPAQRLLPRDLYAIIRMAMSPRPGDRYANVAELAADLRRFANGQPTEAAKSLRQHAFPALMKFTTQFNVRQVLLGGLILLGVLSLGLSGQLYRQTDRNRVSERKVDDLANRAQIESDRADAMIDLLLTSLETSYLSAGKHVLKRDRNEKHRTSLTLSEETRSDLSHGASICRRVLEQPGQLESRHIFKVASLVRRIAVIFDSVGESKQAAEHYGLAASALDRITDSHPSVTAERCWLRYLEARHHEFLRGYASQEDNYEQILVVAERCLEDADPNSRVWSRLHEVAGLVQLARQRSRQALAHLRAVSAAEFGPGSLTKALLVAYRMDGQHEQALPIAERLAQQSPEDDEAWRNLAGLRLHLNRVESAKRAFEKCVALNPSNALGWQGLAWACFRMNQTEQSLKFVEKAIDLAPKNDTVLMARAKFRLHVGQVANAIADFRQALQLRPDSPYVAFPAIVSLAFWEGSCEKDLVHCQGVIHQQSDKWPMALANELRALIELRAGNCEQAAKFAALVQPRSPVAKLTLLTARLDAVNEDQRRQAASELASWSELGWVGLDDSPVAQLLTDYAIERLHLSGRRQPST